MKQYLIFMLCVAITGFIPLVLAIIIAVVMMCVAQIKESWNEINKKK